MKINVDQNHDRLDKFIYQYLENIPLSLIQKLIRKYKIKINNKKSKSNSKIFIGDIIYIYYEFDILPYSKSKIKLSEDTKNIFKNRIIYQNQNFLIINKLKGYAVQRGSKIKNSLKDFYESLLDTKLYIVHRLDKDTSGLMIFAKHRSAASKMSKLFKENLIKKYYIAVTQKKFSKRSGYLIDKNIDEKTLKLFYRQINFNNFKNCFLVRLITGKKHQIRLQFYINNNPIIGDKKFTNNTSDTLLLSSVSIKFYYDKIFYNFKLSLAQIFL